MNVSKKQLSEEILSLVTTHSQLKTCLEGDLLDLIKSNDIEYAAFFFSCSNVRNETSYLTYQVDMFVFDILEDGDENRSDIENTTLQVLNDIVDVMNYAPRWQQFCETNISVDELKYYDKLDRLSGWGCRLDIRTFRESGYCFTPFVGYDFKQINS
jgi:hypothetical protein